MSLGNWPWDETGLPTHQSCVHLSLHISKETRSFFDQRTSVSGDLTHKHALPNLSRTVSYSRAYVLLWTHSKRIQSILASLHVVEPE